MHLTAAPDTAPGTAPDPAARPAVAEAPTSTAAYLDAEQARLLAAIRRLRPDLDEEALLAGIAAEEEAKRRAAIWRGGVVPMGIEAFSLAIDGTPFSARQMQVLVSAGLATAEDLINPNRVVQELVVLWGKGSLSADRLLRDESTGETLTCEAWWRSGRALRLRTYDAATGAVTVTDEPVEIHRTGKSRMLRVLLGEDFGWVTVSATHLFRATGANLSPGEERWLEAGDLVPFASFVRVLTRDGAGTTFAMVLAVEEAGEAWHYSPTVPITHCYFDAEGILHGNSGKDWISARLSGYFAYVMLHMVDPSAYFGRPSGERMEMLNVAPKGDLAKRVYFEYLTRVVRSAPFAPFLLAPQQQILSDCIFFPQINLRMYSLNSSASGMDGYNPIFWVMDEADAFKDRADHSNAEIIHRILRSSASTRWRNHWVGAVITYTREEAGFAIRTYEDGKGDPTYLVDRAATWDVRPDVSRDDPSIASDYRKDPAQAAGLYECLPPPVEGGFFEYPEFIAQATTRTGRAPIATITQDERTIRPHPDGSEAHYVRAVLAALGTPDPARAYYLGVDGGEKGDAFALAIMSVNKGRRGAIDWVCPACARAEGMLCGAAYRAVPHGDVLQSGVRAVCGACGSTPRAFANGVDLGGWHEKLGDAEEEDFHLAFGGQTVSLPRLREELCLAVDPVKALRAGEKTATIDFIAMEEVLATLIPALPVKVTRLDPWQTTSLTQSLRDRTRADVDTIPFSQPEQYKRARLAKVMLYNGLLDLLPSDRRDVQWRRLIRKGQRIDHPEGGEKDLADAEFVAIYLAVVDHLGTTDLGWLL